MSFRRRHLARACALALVLVGACADGTADAPTEEDLGVIGGKADSVLREVHLSLPAGDIKRYRVRTIGLRASLTQTGTVPVQLSAKHYEVDIYGDPSATPTVEAVSDGEVWNWTIRVHNQGDEPLDAVIEVLEWLPSDGPNAPFDGPGNVEIGVISDIDKTLLPPHSGADLPAPYPGVTTLLTTLELGDGRTAGDVHYVTARTDAGAAEIPAWMDAWGLPPGAISTGISGVPWIAQSEKVRDISAILDAFPDQRFVLFGDSSHRDPEAYTEIIETYPGRVIAGFIRKVNNPNPDRLTRLNLVTNYAEAAAILHGAGLLDDNATRAVIGDAVAEGLPLDASEIDALIEAHAPSP